MEEEDGSHERKGSMAVLRGVCLDQISPEGYVVSAAAFLTAVFKMCGFHREIASPRYRAGWDRKMGKKILYS